MRSYKLVALGALSLVVVSVPAHADTDLTGKWVGQFNGVQIDFPGERSPFGYLRDDTKGTSSPRFVEQALQLEVETQRKGLAVGIWTAGEFKKHFVCAQTGEAMWNCVDSGGRASVEVTSFFIAGGKQRHGSIST